MSTRKKLGTRLLLFVEITVFIILAILLCVTLYEINAFTQTSSTQRANSGVLGLNAKIEDYQAQSLKLATIAAAVPDVSDALSSADTVKLDAAVRALAETAQADFIAVTDDSGTVLLNTYDAQSVGKDLSAQSGVKAALQAGAYTTVESSAISRLAASSTVPVTNGSGRVLGTLCLGYALDKDELVDQIKELFQTDVTLFFNDVRVSTTIMQNGERKIGTTLSKNIADIVLTKGENYAGKADILEKPYICSYMPLKNADGEIIGVLFSGEPQDETVAVTYKIAYIIAAIALFALGVLFLELHFYIGAIVSKPLNRVITASRKITQGDRSNLL